MYEARARSHATWAAKAMSDRVKRAAAMVTKTAPSKTDSVSRRRRRSWARLWQSATAARGAVGGRGRGGVEAVGGDHSRRGGML